MKVKKVSTRYTITDDEVKYFYEEYVNNSTDIKIYVNRNHKKHLTGEDHELYNRIIHIVNEYEDSLMTPTERIIKTWLKNTTTKTVSDSRYKELLEKLRNRVEAETGEFGDSQILKQIILDYPY